MRGRRSSRSAAVVLAGCVGLAVMAPGLALAAPVPSLATEDACTAAGYTWTSAGCDDGTSTGSTAGAGTVGAGSAGSSGSSSSSPSSSGSSSTSSSTPGAVTGGTGSAATPEQAVEGGGVVEPGRTPVDETGQNGGEESTPVPEADHASAARTAPAVPATAPTLVAGGEQLAAQLAALPILGDIELPDTFVPGGGNIPLDLPFDIPTEVPEGGFQNPQQACAFLVSGLNAAPEQLENLGSAFSEFCGALPGEFGAIDPTTLIEDLLGLLEGLIKALPTPGHHIPTTPPSHVPADWWGYWHKQYDVDCPELTYEEANAILAWDRSDPFRLDRDGDGEACERNRHYDDDVEYVEYVEYVDAYPVGGVATGDGSTGASGASGMEVALAAGLLSGLGVTGLVLVRRFARQG